MCPGFTFENRIFHPPRFEEVKLLTLILGQTDFLNRQRVIMLCPTSSSSNKSPKNGFILPSVPQRTYCLKLTRIIPSNDIGQQTTQADMASFGPFGRASVKAVKRKVMAGLVEGE
ncbi:hypothetical protein MJO28_010898 [Puccinia striiformis f. sp. tritici]|uniref:Uncharacterized protein n=1 Tax=Puccinia striiformis f. sp. tritici TaxID=168172 RepID=A0ACC0E8Z9_9BASI|nr:hypothetical protein MJO28_010898 [Puccinia striiformis f. sp. tritici]